MGMPSNQRSIQPALPAFLCFRYVIFMTLFQLWECQSMSACRCGEIGGIACLLQERLARCKPVPKLSRGPPSA